MTRRAQFRILAAVDGSAHSRAALASIIRGPWPDTARVRVVVARQTRAPYRRSLLLSAIDRNADAIAQRARRSLAHRWPDTEAIVIDNAPLEAIRTEAERFRADMIVVGWRGYGPARRLLMGSVSRGVIRGTRSAVLVVRRAPKRIRNILIAFDGSDNARTTVSLVASLTPVSDGKVTLVQALELMSPLRGPALAGIRASISERVKQMNAERSGAAKKLLNRAAKELDRAGWQTRVELRTGEPLRELVDAVRSSRPHLIVLGARGTSGVRHLLLGSVAEGMLNRSPVPVLLAR